MKTYLLITGVAALAITAPAAADPWKDESGKRAEKQFEQLKKLDEQRQKQHEKAFEHAKKANEKAIEHAKKAQEKAFEAPKKFVEQRLKQREKLAEHYWKGQEKALEARSKQLEKLAKRQAKLREKAFEQAWKADDDRFEARQRSGADWYSYVPPLYSSPYYSGNDYGYRYDDGYLYQVSRKDNLISAIIPLLGGAFSVGNPLPAGYNVYNVPLQYRDTYYDTDDYSYRYGAGAIYQVDPTTNLIQSIVALLTGTQLGVGQMLPAGYDAYNVPLDYRDQYYDTPDALYRYADGNIYQVDPTTRLIQAVISAVV